MTMQVDKARLDEMLASANEACRLNIGNWTYKDPAMDYDTMRSIITELLELRSLRSTEGKEAEPVAHQHRVWFPDTQRWSEWREGSKPLYDNDFQSRALYATPEAAEAHVSKLREALEPFAALYAESMRDFPDGSSKTERPDDKQAWGFNNVDLTWGDFRRAAALTRSPE